MNRHFSNTVIARTVGYNNQITELVKYLIKYKNLVVINNDRLFSAPSNRSLNTPLDMVFDQMTNTGYLSNFCSLYIDRKNTELVVPDILATTAMNVDFYGLQEAKALTMMQDVKDKIVVNTTSVVKQPNLGTFNISDSFELRSMYVKGLLCRSYATFNENCWLSPSICVYLIETYSKVVAGLISSRYNLDPIITDKIVGFTALFMANRLNYEGSSKFAPGILNRCTFLGNTNYIQNICDEAANILNDIGLEGYFTVDDLATLIANTGVERLSKFTSFEFYRICQILSPDVLMTQVAVEYPPYWMYLILQAISNARVHALIFNLKKMKLYDTKAKEFLMSLKTCRSLYEM